MSDRSTCRQLGRQAAKTTAKSQTVRCSKPDELARAAAALKEPATTARQLPWRYGEKRRKDRGYA